MYYFIAFLVLSITAAQASFTSGGYDEEMQNKLWYYHVKPDQLSNDLPSLEKEGLNKKNMPINAVLEKVQVKDLEFIEVLQLRLSDMKQTVFELNPAYQVSLLEGRHLSSSLDSIDENKEYATNLGWIIYAKENENKIPIGLISFSFRLKNYYGGNDSWRQNPDLKSLEGKFCCENECYILPAYQQKGYGSLAKDLLIQYVKENNPQVDYLLSIIHTKNVASQKVAKAKGFQLLTSSYSFSQIWGLDLKKP